MHHSDAFWKWFTYEAYPRLGGRSGTFLQMFQHLDKLDGPVSIVETGCIRSRDNWNGDGCSTLLFDRYATEREGCRVFSVDIDQAAVNLAREMTGEWTYVHCGDSIEYCCSLAPWTEPPIGLLYLDSLDADMEWPWPSAEHHYAELKAALPLIHENTLVVVDDSPGMDGKGLLVAMYALEKEVRCVFSQYQIGFVGFKSTV